MSASVSGQKNVKSRDVHETSEVVVFLAALRAFWYLTVNGWWQSLLWVSTEDDMQMQIWIARQSLASAGTDMILPGFALEACTDLEPERWHAAG